MTSRLDLVLIVITKAVRYLDLWVPISLLYAMGGVFTFGAVNLFVRPTVITFGSAKKPGPLCFKAYNFRNVEQIFTEFGTNHGLFILNIIP